MVSAQLVRHPDDKIVYGRDLNRLIDQYIGNDGAQRRNVGYDGAAIDPTTGASVSTGNYAEIVRSGVGLHARWRHSNDLTDVGTVTDSGVTFGVGTFVTLVSTGATTLGDNAADPLTVNATATFAAPALFSAAVTHNGNLVANANVVLGSDAADTLGVLATATFSEDALFLKSIDVRGNAAIGDGSADTVTVPATTQFRASVTFRNAAGTTFPLYVDPTNTRVIVGSTTALGSDTTPALHVVGRLYVAPEAANDLALQIRRSNAFTVGWSLGVASDTDFVFKDDAGTETFRVGDVANAYQAKVTGDLNVTANIVCDFLEAEGADIDGPTDITATSGTFDWQDSGNSRLKINATGVGFFGATPVPPPNVVGVLSGSPTLAQLTSVVRSLLAALDETELGLVIDGTT